jgi:putative nucleotidyltransferase with HDIG domain
MNNVCLAEKDALNVYLDAVEHLPPTPDLMIKLIELFRKPDRDIDEIIELMRQDPSVTTEVLRRCNSSFFGNDEPVLDIYDAVFQLGFYEVYRISVALFGLQTISMAKLAECIPIEALWRHSAITAIVGGVIARQLSESEGLVFTAGLLHDIGRIVLASQEGPRYAELLRQHGMHGTVLNDAEKAAFGFNHCEVGARLLSRWGVPESVFMPVLCHHQIASLETFQRMSAIVCLANLMAHCIDENGPDKPCELPEAALAMTLLGLEPADKLELEKRAREEMKHLSSLLVTGK